MERVDGGGDDSGSGDGVGVGGVWRRDLEEDGRDKLCN
tara:strand:+ start:779 stop:892 length:114 start_codon:yes stop_codon:yes gene_type:complete